jgi:hypothetical protein
MQSSHTHIQAHIHQATLHHSFVDTNQGIKKPLLWWMPQKSTDGVPKIVLKSTGRLSDSTNHFTFSVTIVTNPTQQTDSNTNLLIGTNETSDISDSSYLDCCSKRHKRPLNHESTRTFITPVDTRRKPAALSTPKSCPWQCKQRFKPVGGYRCIIIATKV